MKAFDALYAELPNIECKNQCWDSCSSLWMTDPEHKRLTDRGFPIENFRDGNTRQLGKMCPALTMFNTCSVYDARPLICRLFGLTKTMSCGHGCVPEGGYLTDRQAFEFIARAFDLAGDHEEAEAIRETWSHPDAQKWYTEHDKARKERESIQRRIQLLTPGPKIFVRGQGRVSSKPPARGANSLGDVHDL